MGYRRNDQTKSNWKKERMKEEEQSIITRQKGPAGRGYRVVGVLKEVRAVLGGEAVGVAMGRRGGRGPGHGKDSDTVAGAALAVGAIRRDVATEREGAEAEKRTSGGGGDEHHRSAAR
ncbi:hypothetical protein B296_00047568 [Ensete ventricosum]|uniref:Uncharacterized protein n=1 Tax=Ensete ventricosum TaxID=4639 RepID=A0A426YYT2_ENSVE|nr:hypothetical protein B296_00047568 [Ensete ventricosum]